MGESQPNMLSSMTRAMPMVSATEFPLALAELS